MYSQNLSSITILNNYFYSNLTFQADVDNNGFVDKKEFLDLVQKKSVHLSETQQNTIKEYLKVSNKKYS